MVFNNDPARAHNRSIAEIATRGALFSINEGIEVIEGEGCKTRLIGWPGNGTRMVSFHTHTCAPGATFDDISHPITEKSMICIRGSGEVKLSNKWNEIAAGNVVYVPHNCAHAFRNSSRAKEDLVILSFNCPPPMDYYQKIGLFQDGSINYGKVDQLLLSSKHGELTSECLMRPNDLGGAERGYLKGAESVSQSGGIFNIFTGVPFTKFISEMRFVLWPGIGTRLCNQHVAFHLPYQVFQPHYHPISEDAIYCVAGRGKGYLESRWIDMAAGDILYAPANVKHGTGGGDTKFIASGCASPPQFDLYERAGYLTNGVLQTKNHQVNYPEEFLSSGVFDILI